MIALVLLGYTVALIMFLKKYKKEKRLSLLVIAVIILTLLSYTLHIAIKGTMSIWTM